MSHKIHSDTVRAQLKEKELIRTFLNDRASRDHSGSSVDEVLAELGRIYDADRAYIFEIDEVSGMTKNTYEWCREGVTPEIDHLQAIPCSIYGDWLDHFRTDGEYTMYDIEDIAGTPNYPVLAAQNIKSLISVPFLISGALVGFLGLDNPRQNSEMMLLLSVAASDLYSEMLYERQREMAVRNAELEIQNRDQQALKDALLAAEHANHAKTAFLNNMSHDIRTPMNAIIGFTSLAAAHVENTEQVSEYLAKIQVSSSHLLSLINDVLDMSRIESGKVQLEEQEASLSVVLQDLRTIVQADITSRQLEFHIDTVDMVNELVICDKLRLNQILLNLMSNAMKFTPPGGTVTVRVVQKPDAPTGYASYDFVVKDTGIGMNPDFVSHVFEPFSREQSSTVSGIQGTGLGMAITKNLVDMMGGTISVESEQGSGTTFTVSLTLRVAESAAGGESAEETPLQDFSGRRLLLVEDNALNQEIAVEILSETGFIVDVADNGKAAVERMEAAAQDAYDLILMDIQMPVMDGYEATRRIRALSDPIKSTIPILAMTANAFDEDKKLAYDAGMNGHIAKPINVPLMLRTLAEILN